jgi:RND family efflux transporter MFP subunit
MVVALAVGFGGGLLATSLLLHEHDHHDHEPEAGHPDHHQAECEISSQTAKAIGLETHLVDFGPVQDVIELLGTVAALPDQHHIIASRTSGQALHIHAQVGQSVKKGDILIEIDSAELARNIFEARRMEVDYQKLLVDVTRTKGRIQQLDLERKTSEESAQLAEGQYERLKSAEQAVSLNVLNASKAAALQARAGAKLKAVELEVTKEEAKALAEQTKALRLSRDALLAVANVDPSQIEETDSQDNAVLCAEVPARLSIVRLRSPIDGVVVDRSISPGQGVEAGQSLMVVADYNRVQVHGELPELLISKLRQDKPIKVRVRSQSEDQQTIEGEVRFISPVIDPVKRTAHLIVDASNPGRVLRDGAFVTITVIQRDMTNKEDWPVVAPASSVLREGPAYYVFKQVTPNKLIFERQDIAPGKQNDQVVEIKDGLIPGDVIVSRGSYSLSQMQPAGAGEAADAHAGHSH